MVGALELLDIKYSDPVVREYAVWCIDKDDSLQLLQASDFLPQVRALSNVTGE